MAVADDGRSELRKEPPGGWPIPRSVYVHVPFCRHRCGYCNFSVIADRDDLVGDFLSAIDREAETLGRPTVDTVFIGGGTPTHLAPADLQRLISIVHQRFSITDNAEVSVEANPEDISAEKIRVLTDGGINRISLGVQSFNGDKLRLLERGHTRSTAIAAIETSAAAIPNCSIDLIFAAPNETPEDWQSDLDTAYSVPIRHLSTYALTFEKGTSFWSRRMRGTLTQSGEDNEVAMYNAARDAAKAVNWEHYEVSNFAANNDRCRHNVAYWHGSGWYAIGPGAAAFTDGCRTVNHRSPRTYLKRVLSGQTPVAESEAIGIEQYTRERAAFGIRMRDGINLPDLGNETGYDLATEITQTLDRFIDQGMLEAIDNKIRLTETGILFADTVATEFLG